MKIIELKVDKVYNFDKHYVSGQKCWISWVEYNNYFLFDRTSQIEILWKLPAADSKIKSCNLYGQKLNRLVTNTELAAILSISYAVGLSIYIILSVVGCFGWVESRVYD